MPPIGTATIRHPPAGEQGQPALQHEQPSPRWPRHRSGRGRRRPRYSPTRTVPIATSERRVAALVAPRHPPRSPAGRRRAGVANASMPWLRAAPAANTAGSRHLSSPGQLRPGGKGIDPTAALVADEPFAVPGRAPAPRRREARPVGPSGAPGQDRQGPRHRRRRRPASPARTAGSGRSGAGDGGHRNGRPEMPPKSRSAERSSNAPRSSSSPIRAGPRRRAAAPRIPPRSARGRASRVPPRAPGPEPRRSSAAAP